MWKRWCFSAQFLNILVGFVMYKDAFCIKNQLNSIYAQVLLNTDDPQDPNAYQRGLLVRLKTKREIF